MEKNEAYLEDADDIMNNLNSSLPNEKDAWWNEKKS
jgi:hypothetical protein